MRVAPLSPFRFTFHTQTRLGAGEVFKDSDPPNHLVMLHVLMNVFYG